MAALVMGLAVLPDPAPQQPASVPAVSLERIRKQMETADTGEGRIDVAAHLPVATFKSSVDQRVYMLSFREQLHKDFDLTPFQRQSQEWRSKCCGIGILQLAKGIQRAWRDQEARKARDQVARELAQVEAAARK